MTDRKPLLVAAKRYRKKPIVIEALQFDGSEESIESIRVFAQGARFKILRPLHQGQGHEAFLEIPTREGSIYADPGDWIIKGIEGEFYPCKPNIFEATYEPE